MKRKFFAGWLNPDNMQNDDWLGHWIDNAKEAETNDEELVIFKIPKDKRIVEAIEAFLQTDAIVKDITELK